MGQIRKRKLYEQVMDGMEEMLKSEGLKPGDRLQSEKELSLFFGVSKTVIREALCAMQAAGKIEVRHGTGIFVGKYSDKFFFDALQDKESGILSVAPQHWFELKQFIEIEAAELAAQRASADEVQKLKVILLAISDAALRLDDRSVLTQRFLAVMVAAMHNPLFVKLHAMAEQNEGQQFQFSSTPESVEALRLIYDAIKKKRPESARKAVKDFFDRHVILCESDC